jgi:hypothetical protein
MSSTAQRLAYLCGCGLPANVFRELEPEGAKAIPKILYFCEYKSVKEFM